MRYGFDEDEEAFRSEMRRWADTARTEILKLAPSPARAAFESMCDFVVARTG